MAPGGFTLMVALVGRKPTRYAFDQDRVLVGRGRDCDLRIEHAAVSRAQFLLERGRGSMGEARFRITPYESTNGTFVNDRPAVEGTLMPGDVVAVGDVRVVLERKLDKGKAAAAPGGKKDIPPARAVLLGLTTLMALIVGWLLFAGEGDDTAGDVTTQTPLFGNLAPARCGEPLECENRAVDHYRRGKKLVAQAGADPGNLYRAVLELDRAKKLRDLSRRPVPEMADVEVHLDQARTQAVAGYEDARFRLQRAIAAGDKKRCAAEAALLARLVPDENHPYRVKLDAYRRGLPKEENK
jgi:predicted component of type VI protein secretion system